MIRNSPLRANVLEHDVVWQRGLNTPAQAAGLCSLQGYRHSLCVCVWLQFFSRHSEAAACQDIFHSDWSLKQGLFFHFLFSLSAFLSWLCWRKRQRGRHNLHFRRFKVIEVIQINLWMPVSLWDFNKFASRLDLVPKCSWMRPDKFPLNPRFGAIASCCGS